LTAVVVDASVALAWGFPDEASEYADTVLVALEEQRILVPVIWALEITNALLIGQRHKRINSTEIQRFISLLEGLTVHEDLLPIASSVANILPLAREYSLSAYDASYLAVAIRHNAVLATLDTGLKSAAKKAGIKLLEPKFKK
jgi:predicted nucleic acid-binding protein